MQKSARGVCLAMAAGLLAIHGAGAEPYRHAPTGIVFPDRLAGLEKKADITDFEPDYPGFGISVGYNGPGITVTVYLYTLGIKRIPAGPDSSILKEELQHAEGDITTMEERGSYANVKKISEGKAPLNVNGSGPVALYAYYRYTQNGESRVSYLYLTGFRNHFLKIRFTYDKDVRLTAERTRIQFLEEFSRILGAGAEETPKQEVPAPK